MKILNSSTSQQNTERENETVRRKRNNTKKMNENLRHLYRDTIVGEAYMKTLNELLDELGGVDEEIKEKMACIFEEVRRRVVLFFRFSLRESRNLSTKQCFEDMLAIDMNCKSRIEVIISVRVLNSFSLSKTTSSFAGKLVVLSKYMRSMEDRCTGLYDDISQ